MSSLGPPDRWSGSRLRLERARRSLAGGVSSPFRAKFPVPLYFADASGSRIWDVDGNRYIDYTLAWGPLILGHKHPALVEALRRQAERPHILGAQHDLEYEVAEKIQQLVPCAERVAFTSSGSEAVQLALRLARAATGRNLILKFEGHYHGWMDSVLISHHPQREQMGPPEAPHAVPESRGQAPNALENVLVAPWNRIEIAESLFERRGRQIAAIITEPVLCNSGCLLPRPGYLKQLRRLADRYGALLIFDEIITGFRMGLGGAQGYYGVTPDLATFGKALAGGPPLSAVAGRREIMELIGDGGVAFGGTFNRNPNSLACARATLGELERERGAALAQANRIGTMLMEGIREAARRCGVLLQVTGFGAAFALHFTERAELGDYRDTLADDRERLAAFLLHALEKGVYALPDGRMYVSAAHTEQDVAETVAAVESALLQLRASR
ncbi:MAG: aspartate aminotransferase family protein [Bryobacterales bacterium]|nr:aspartate aminotransferase family protein [Bryobacteraceae bacterium]MDW8129980.1 aspartate aminotransferase family protein [Bryobacterales bacterium]